MATGTYPITGIPVPQGQPIPTRPEINQLSSGSNPRLKKQLSLYIRALSELQRKPVEDKLGFYQLAGIHGEPLAPWDGEGEAPGGPKNSFCPHGSIIFPTWHRPYVMLLEQRIWETMKELIKTMGIPAADLQEWNDAADTWRIPYWDWTKDQEYLNGKPGIPKIFTTETLSILEPSGGDRSHPNPLWLFYNPKLDDQTKAPMTFGDERMGDYMFRPLPTGQPWHNSSAISRFGVVRDGPENWKGLQGVNDWEKVNLSLENPRWRYGGGMEEGPYDGMQFREGVLRMFSEGYLTKWGDFASVRFDPNAGDNVNFLSLEYIHNNIHADVGGWDPTVGLGHMGSVPVAAMDPIFWMHHANVDRLFAVWQGINPEIWFDEAEDPEDPFNPDSELIPFHMNTSKGRYTSELVRDIKKLNYNYEILDIKGLEPGSKEYQDELRKRIAGEYRQAAAVVGLTKSDVERQAQPGQDIPGTNKQETWDYVINVVYDPYVLEDGLSYTIAFFIGDTPGINQDRNGGNFVGKVYTFTNSPSRCGNCAKSQNKGQLSLGQVFLTGKLMSRCQGDREGAVRTNADGQLANLTPDTVDKYLLKNLRWEYVDSMGQVREANQFPRTKVFVGAQKRVLATEGRHGLTNGGLPTFVKDHVLYDATRGKVGGVGPNDGQFGLHGVNLARAG